MILVTTPTGNAGRFALAEVLRDRVTDTARAAGLRRLATISGVGDNGPESGIGAVPQGYGASRALANHLVDMFDAITAGRDMAAPQAEQADWPTDLGSWARRDLRDAVLHVASAAAG